MSGFPLHSLTPTHLEQVINKAGLLISLFPRNLFQFDDYENYFRLQQTCHKMYDFIRSSSKIFVHTWRSLVPEWDEANSCCYFEHKGKKINLEVLYGVRFWTIRDDKFCFSDEAQLKKLCSALEKNRITVFFSLWLEEKITKGILAFVLNSWKVESISLTSHRSDRFEAVLLSKTVKIVELWWMDFDSIVNQLPEFLSAFEELVIHASAFRPERHSAFCKVLEIFLSKSWPKLETFTFNVPLKRDKHSQRRLETMFSLKFKPTKTYDGNKSWSAMVQLPEYFPCGYSCKVEYVPDVWEVSDTINLQYSSEEEEEQKEVSLEKEEELEEVSIPDFC